MATLALSDDFKKRATAKLDAASGGKFFQSNSARLMPSFDRGAVAADDGREETNGDEFVLGTRLGEGAFCEVMEISAIALKRKSDGNDDHGEEEFLPQPKQDQENNDEPDPDFPVNLFQNKSEIRDYMSENCIRKDETDGSDQARYALKKLKQTDKQTHVEQGLIDISIEARFLACLNHPNVIKMRGIAGKPLTPEFGLVLDRLYLTLEDQMDTWTEEMKMASSGGFCGCFKSVDNITKNEMISRAMTVAYDLSCALRYIHSLNLVYRDIKPENAGFDVRGDIKLFDFGFCKELTKKLLDKPSGLYKLTRMTGSYPYMAPENFLGKPYGKSTDTFSFGVLLWEMLHCKFAFYHYDKADYKNVVIDQKYRPSIDSSLSTRTKELIKEAWDPDPQKRPTFDRISLILRAEYQEMTMTNEGGMSRSERMMGASMRSFRAKRNK